MRIIAVITLATLIAMVPLAHGLSVGADYVKGIAASEAGFINDTAIYGGNLIFAMNSSGIIWKKSVPSELMSVSEYVAVCRGNSLTVLSSNGTKLWEKRVDGTITAVSATKNGVFVGTDSGKIYLFNSSGKVRWVYDTKCCIESISALGNFAAVSDIHGNIYYFEEFDRFPWSFTSSEGDVAWMYKTGWCIWKCDALSKLCTFPDVVVKTTENGVFVVSKFMRYAYLFSRSGYLLWNKSFDAKPVSFSCDRKGRVFALGFGDGKVCVFNGDGKLMWTMDFNSPAVTAVSENGNYVAVGSGKLVCLFNTTGKLLWFGYFPEGNVPEGIRSLAVSNSGKIAACCGYAYYIVPKLEVSKPATVTPTPTPTPSPTPVPTPVPTAKAKPLTTKAKPEKPDEKPKTKTKQQEYVSYIPLAVVAVLAGVGVFARGRIAGRITGNSKKAKKVKSKKAKSKAKSAKSTKSAKSAKSVKAKKKVQ